MINVNKLKINLVSLQESLPQKPSVYTFDFPKTIAETLTKYANRRTVNLFGINVYNYNEHGWPVPLYVDNSDIKVGLINNLFYRKMEYGTNKTYRRLRRTKKIKKINLWNIKIKPWNWIGIPIYRHIYWKDSVDSGVIDLFEANLKFFRKKLLAHPYLRNWEKIIAEIFSAYRHGHWASCIYTIYPLLDHAARHVLNTDSLRHDMQTVCKLFRQLGIGQGETDVFMAHTNTIMVWNKVREKEISPEDGKVLTEKGNSYTLNMIGPALSSFLQFSNRYYGYIRTDMDHADSLNRHAIIHGLYIDFSTKANVIRLFTYLYLLLELDPILKILLSED